MNTPGLRRLYASLLLIVFMLPGIIAVGVIFAFRFDAPIATEVFHEMETETESDKKTSEESNIGYTEYCTGHDSDYSLLPLLDISKRANMIFDIDYKEAIYLSIPTPPPDFFMV